MDEGDYMRFRITENRSGFIKPFYQKVQELLRSINTFGRVKYKYKNNYYAILRNN